jgi:hypothetical protein
MIEDLLFGFQETPRISFETASTSKISRESDPFSVI